MKKQGYLVSIFLSIWLISPALAVVTWTGGTDSSWHTGANWSGGAVPTNSDDVVIDTAATVTASSAIAGKSLTLSNGGGLTISVSYTLLDTTLSSGGTLHSSTVGTSVYLDGKFTQSGGWLYFGNSAASTATITGGILLNNSNDNRGTVIGNNYGATVNLGEANGATTKWNVTALGLGIRFSNETTLGQLNMTGGTLVVSSERLLTDWYGLMIGVTDVDNRYANGELNLSGGIVNVLPGSNNGFVGVGGVKATSSTLHVGRPTGKLNISSGQLNAETLKVAFHGENSQGTVTLSDSGVLRVRTLNTSDTKGTATYNWNGGTLVMTNYTGDFTNTGTTLAPETWIFSGENYQQESLYGTTTIDGDYTQNSGKLSLDVAFDEAGTVVNQDFFLVTKDLDLAGGELFLNLTTEADTVLDGLMFFPFESGSTTFTRLNLGD
ncbi:MAG: hypothetical protein Q4D98_03730 [Planctomycetia bacterium]|nr:hypothetical protein [Planctomycetia bacterium]